MSYKLLFILVEGDDDERFFKRIIKPKYEEKYSSVKLWQYAQVKEEKVTNFLNSIKQMNADYIYVRDIHNAPCVRSKKQKIRDNFRNIDKDRIIVVIKEIEGWYLAGLNNLNSKKLRVPSFSTTDNIAKEQFDKIIPKNFDSRIDFMSEILNYFSIDTAKQKNKTFKYFFEKYTPGPA